MSEQTISEEQSFFSYDPNDRFRFHDSAEKAKAACEESFEWYKDEAAEGWPENTDSVCWGQVLGRATLIRQIDRPNEDQLDADKFDAEGTCWSNGFDCLQWWEVKDLAADPRDWVIVNIDGEFGNVEDSHGNAIFIYVDLRDCERAVAAHNAALSTRDQEIARLKARIDDLEATENYLTKERDCLNARISELEKERDAWKDKYDRCIRSYPTENWIDAD